MFESNVSKIIEAVKNTRDAVKADCSTISMEYSFPVKGGDRKTLIVRVDSKAAYLNFDDAKISKKNLQD